MLALAAIISGLFVYIAYLYSVFFQNLQREWLWVFLVLAALYMAEIVSFLITWRKRAQQMTEEQSQTTEGVQAQSLLEKAKRFYDSLQPQGYNFLWKLHASEFMETVTQAWNLTTVYSCSLPVEVTIPFCLVLACDCFFTGWETLQENTAVRRNRQMWLGTCLDFFCILIPVSILWFEYQVPVDIHEMIQITLLPSLFILAKLDDIFEEVVREHCASEVMQLQERKSVSSNRRRLSLFGRTKSESVSKEQQKHVPRRIKVLLAGAKLAFGVFFIAVAIVQLATPAQCEQLREHCTVKVPFCNTLFEPSCNCAVLYVRNHNMTVLPPEFTRMTALKKVDITHGPLERLPDDIGKLKDLSRLSVNFNKLTALPDALANLKKLTTLFAGFNAMKKVPEALLRHGTLQTLAVNTNKLTHVQLNMPNLAYLDLSNNSIATISAMRLPFLLDLYLDGNLFMEFPVLSEVSSTLSWLTISRNNITKLHESLKEMSNLELLDLRNNSFSTLPSWLSDLGSLTHLTVHDNPLCSNGWSAEGNLKALVDTDGCKAQCSPMCLDAQLEYTDCRPGCNPNKCIYANGQCSIV